MLVSDFSIRELVVFAMPVFDVPTIHTMILVVEKSNPRGNVVKIANRIKHRAEIETAPRLELAQTDLGKGSNSVFDVFVTRIFSKAQTDSEPLGDICYIRQCIKTGDDEKYVRKSDQTLKSPWKPTLRGKSIMRYAIAETDLFVKYGNWLARNWNNTSFYEVEKIGIRETGRRIIAALDTEHRYFLSSLYSIYPRRAVQADFLKYVLAILNSKLGTYFAKTIALNYAEGAFTKMRTNQLARIPIKTIGVDSLRPRYAALIRLAERIIATSTAMAHTDRSTREHTTQARLVEELDARIDEAVFDLYGLNSDEIAIVEAELST